MTTAILDNLAMKSKREEFFYDFGVSIWFYGGMFCIGIITDRIYSETGQIEDYEFGFGTLYEKDGYYPGFDKAIQVTLNNIRNSSESRKVKDMAESALARACVQFHLKHKGML